MDPKDISDMVEKSIREQIMADAKATKPAKPEEPEVKIEPKVRTKGKDQKMFSEVFGVKVDHDFPVTVLKKEDLPDEVRGLVPAVDPTYAVQVEEAYHLMQAWEDGDKVLISGPTGSGKSSLIKYCAAMTNRPFIRINMNGDIESSAIFGQMVVENGATVWRDGAATEAIKYGAVLLVDEWEIMPPEVGMGFQNVLEDNGYLFLKEMPGTSEDKMIVPHANFRLVYAGNTVGQGDETGSFAGVNVQNTATIDRFQTTIILGYLGKEHETKVLKNAVVGLPAATIKKMLQYADLVRTGNDQGNMTLTMSPRTLINWGKKTMRYGDTKEGLVYSFLNKLNTNDRKLASEFYTKVFGK